MRLMDLEKYITNIKYAVYVKADNTERRLFTDKVFSYCHGLCELIYYRYFD